MSDEDREGAGGTGTGKHIPDSLVSDMAEHEYTLHVNEDLSNGLDLVDVQLPRSLQGGASRAAIA